MVGKMEAGGKSAAKAGWATPQTNQGAMHDERVWGRNGEGGVWECLSLPSLVLEGRVGVKEGERRVG